MFGQWFGAQTVSAEKYGAVGWTPLRFRRKEQTAIPAVVAEVVDDIAERVAQQSNQYKVEIDELETMLRLRLEQLDMAYKAAYLVDAKQAMDAAIKQKESDIEKDDEELLLLLMQL